MLVSFASRDIRVRYKQTVLGVAWAVLQPLAFLGLFVLVFARGGGFDGGGAPYAASTLAALVGWQFLATAVSNGSQALISSAGILRKVYFPREAATLGAVGATLLDLGIGLTLAVLLEPLFGGSPGWTLVLLPLLVVLLALPAVAVALPLSALNVYFRDVRYAVPVAIQLTLFASPVAYPVTQIPERFRLVYALLNPLVGPLDALRRVLALGAWPDPALTAVSAASGTVLLVLGYRLFKRLEPELADVT